MKTTAAPVPAPRTPSTQETEPPTRDPRPLSFLFAAPLFLSAALLFWIQPLVAKTLLPLLGGTPAVWNTCMLFFQGMLLAGYAYVLVSARRLGVRRQSVLHLALLFAAAASAMWLLPAGISDAAARDAPPAEGSPAAWLLWTLLKTVGLPLFVISASAPLLQQWFSRVGHASSSDPYFLYAASNAGSLLALAAFPALLEPRWTIDEQGRMWALGYAALALLVAACAFALWRAGGPGAETTEGPDEALTVERRGAATFEGGGADAALAVGRGGAVTSGRRLLWTALAFVPSSLVLGVTTYVTTDVAAVPLLWVVPLALYLLTFVLAFGRRRVMPPRMISRIMPGAAIVLALVYLSGAAEPSWFLVPLHLLFFFIAAYVCHARLARERPAAAHLAEYYLWVALGGALGGLFNAILAPLVFDSVLEYPLVVVLACLLRPPEVEDEKAAGANEVEKAAGARSVAGRGGEFAGLGEDARGGVEGYDEAGHAGRRARALDFVLPLGVGVLVAALSVVAARLPTGPVEKVALSLGVPLVLVHHFFTKRRVRFALALGVVMLASGLFFREPGARTLHAERNFYGTVRVTYDAATASHRLQHGSTIHGRQFTDAARACEPLSYYHRKGPLGSVFEAFDARGGGAAHVAAVGLGAGASVAYSRAGQTWTFYEINPAMIRIARDARYFTYLRDCAVAPVEVVTGDARLRLESAPDGHYGLIILDAFSSDAIPAHLLTREALGLYLRKLAAGGWVAFHVSNRSLRLDAVVAGLAADAGLTALVFNDLRYDSEAGKAPSQWVVAARRADDLDALRRDARWQPLEQQVKRPELWTDKFSNIISVFRWLG